jgi:hypothetical protein
LIRIKDLPDRLGDTPPKSNKEEIEMPFDAAMLSLAVTVVFVGFAAALIWADSQTRLPHADEPAPKRRSF